MPVKGVTNLSPGDHPRCKSCGNRFRTDLMREVVLRTEHSFYLGPFCRDVMLPLGEDGLPGGKTVGCLTLVQNILDAGQEAGRLALEVERLEGELGRANSMLEAAEGKIRERDGLIYTLERDLVRDHHDIGGEA